MLKSSSNYEKYVEILKSSTCMSASSSHHSTDMSVSQHLLSLPNFNHQASSS